MKKALIGALIVIVVYGIGVFLKINMLIPMLGFIILAGLIFYLTDGYSMKVFSNTSHSTGFQDIHNGEISYRQESQRKTGENNSSVILISIALTAILCIIHYNLFIR